MKLELKIDRKIGLVLFVFLTVFLVLQNPFLTQINIYGVTSQDTVSMPTNNGLSIQNSVIVLQNSNEFAYNSTLNAYHVTVSYFNFGSLFLLFSPIVVYLYFEFKPKKVEKA